MQPKPAEPLLLYRSSQRGGRRLERANPIVELIGRGIGVSGFLSRVPKGDYRLRKSRRAWEERLGMCSPRQEQSIDAAVGPDQQSGVEDRVRGRSVIGREDEIDVVLKFSAPLRDILQRGFPLLIVSDSLGLPRGEEPAHYRCDNSGDNPAAEEA